MLSSATVCVPGHTGFEVNRPSVTFASFDLQSERFFSRLIGFVIQSTLVISNSKGLYETLRDIRSSTYQIYETEEKTFNRTTTVNRMNT